MHLSTLFSITALLISGAFAASIPISSLFPLTKRQFITTPQSCDPECSPGVQKAQYCGGLGPDYSNFNFACICTTEMFAGVVACANCATAVDSYVSATDLQKLINTAASACYVAGYDVGDTAINGGGQPGNAYYGGP